MNISKNTFDSIKHMANFAPCGIGIFDVDTYSTILLNAAYFKMLGYTADEYDVENNKYQVFSKKTFDNLYSQIDKCGQINDYEYKLMHKNCELVWVKLDATVISLDGHKCVFAAFTDISFEKESNERLNLIAENTGCSISMFKIKNGIKELIYANNLFYQKTGVKRENSKENMHILNSVFMTDEDSKRIENAVNKALETGTSGDVEHRFTTVDGKFIWVKRHFSVVKQDEPNSILLISAVTDITQEKEAELKAELEHSRFQKVVDELKAVVFEWNLKNGNFYFSNAYKEYSISTIKNQDILNNKDHLDIVHPDDAEKLYDFFEDIKSGNERSETIIRMKKIDGKYYWCRMIGFFYKDNDDKHDRIMGVIIDINEERERSFMLNSLLNELPGGVGIFTLAESLECYYFNENFASISGRTHEEIKEIMKNDDFLKRIIAPADFEKTINMIKKYVNAGEPINLNFRIVKKDGNISWLHLSALKIREEYGHSVYYCVFTTPSNETRLYQNIVEDSQSGIVVAERLSRRILYLNDKSATFCGFNNKESLIGRPILDVLEEAKIEPFLRQSEIDSLTRDSFSEFHVTRLDRYLSIRAKALLWNDVDSYIIYVSDETNEHKRQIQLQQLIDGVPTGIGIYTVHNGKISLEYLNQAFYEMLGMTRKQRTTYLVDGAINSVYQDDREKVYSAIARLEKGDKKSSTLCRICNNEGKWVWMKLTGSVVERSKDYLKIYTAFTDCNDLIQIQQEQQSDRAKLQAAMESARIFEWRYDFVKRVVIDSGTMGMRYHWPKVIENIPDVISFLEETKQIHPDSSSDLRWLYEHCSDGKRIERDLRYRSADRLNYIWLHVVYSPVVNSDGSMTEVIGTAVDITEQKEREQNYEEQLRLKKLTAKDAMAIAVFNLTKNYIIESECFLSKVKRIENCSSIDEMLKDICDNTASDFEKEKFKNAKDVLSLIHTYESGTAHIEIRHHLYDDSRWMLTSIDMLTNPHTGDIEAILVLRDVTEMVRTELIVDRLMHIDYEYIMTVDATTGRAKPCSKIMKNSAFKDVLIKQSNSLENNEITIQYLSNYMSPQDAERVIEQTNYLYVKNKLKNAPLYEMLYSVNIDEVCKYRRIMYTYLDDSHDTILCAIQDVTETYEQEQKMQKKLKTALLEAEIANKAKTDFLARMSHDMRTPMNGILGLAKVSENENDSDILKSNISQIKESGSYLLQIINDTLDFQQIESGKLKLTKQVTYTATIVNSIYEMVSPFAKEKGVKFNIVNRNADMQWYINIDSVRVRQLFVILLTNAIKFTPHGGTVTMEINNISRDVMVSSNCINIIDNGIGMSEDFIKTRIFKPFEQEKRDITTQYTGSGLGLSIAYNLVKIMGGHIEVSSEKGKGSIFSVYLDFESVDEKTARTILEKKHEEQSGKLEYGYDLTGKYILLIEDHPLNAMIAENLLKKAGCMVDWQDDGKKGLDAFSASAINQYDAILMDIRMPVMDGLEATKAIRALKRQDAKSVPIIAVTANTYPEDIKNCIDAGMDAHIAKPYDITDLLNIMIEQIKRKRPFNMININNTGGNKNG